MLRRWWKTTVSCSIIFVVFVWMVGPSESFGKCVKDRKSHEAYKALHEKESLLIKFVARLRLNFACGFVSANENTGAISTLAGVVVAVFTGTLWWVTWGMVDIADKQRTDMQRSIKAAEDAATAAQESVSVARSATRVQLRAYVQIEAVNGAWAKDYESFAIEARIKNFWNTPCYDLGTWAGVHIDRLPETNAAFPRPPADMPVIPSNLPPSGFAKINLNSGAQGKAFVPFLRAGTHAIYFYGELTYRDVFGEVHKTKFRLVLEGEAIFSGLGFRPCLEGNLST